MPRSIASIAFDSGAGLRMKPGSCPVIACAEGWAKRGAHEVGVDEAEVGAADGAPLGADLHAQRVRERLDAGLRGRVGAHQGRVRDGRQRGDVRAGSRGAW